MLFVTGGCYINTTAYTTHCLAHGAVKAILFFVIVKVAGCKGMIFIITALLLLIKIIILNVALNIIVFCILKVFFRPIAGVCCNTLRQLVILFLMLFQVWEQGGCIGRFLVYAIIDNKLVRG